MARTRRWRLDGKAAPCGQGAAGGAALLIVNAPDRVKDCVPPSSTTTSQGGPGGAVAVLTGTLQVTLVGLEWTFVPMIGLSPALTIFTWVMSLRLAPMIWRVIDGPFLSMECE